LLTELRQYTNHSAQTATPGQLVVMLYDGFLRFAAQGRAALERGDLGEAGQRLTRAQDIVTELRLSLDMTHGAIPQNLASIYEYVAESLTSARLTRESAHVTEAMRCMSDLRSAWTQIVAVPKPASTSSVPARGVNLVG
jgi:flagellar protein FliS